MGGIALIQPETAPVDAGLALLLLGLAAANIIAYKASGGTSLGPSESGTTAIGAGDLAAAGVAAAAAAAAAIASTEAAVAAMTTNALTIAALVQSIAASVIAANLPTSTATTRPTQVPGGTTTGPTHIPAQQTVTTPTQLPAPTLTQPVTQVAFPTTLAASKGKLRSYGEATQAGATPVYHRNGDRVANPGIPEPPDPFTDTHNEHCAETQCMFDVYGQILAGEGGWSADEPIAIRYIQERNRPPCPACQWRRGWLSEQLGVPVELLPLII